MYFYDFDGQIRCQVFQKWIQNSERKNFIYYSRIYILLEYHTTERWEPRGVEEAGCKIYSGAPTVSQTTG